MHIRGIAYFPLAFVLLYIGMTLAISTLGPIGYIQFNIFAVGIFMSFVCLFFSFGYWVAIITPIPISRRFSIQALFSVQSKIFTVCFWIAFSTTALVFLRSAVAGTLSLDLSASGTAYLESYAGYERNTGNYSLDFLISSFAGFPTFLATVWGIYYFRSFPRARRYWLLAMISATIIVYTISGGKQKQFGDFLIYCLTLFTITSAIKGNLKISAIFKVILLSLIGATVLSVMLSYRYAASGINVDNINAVIHPLTYMKTEHIVFQILGPDSGFALGMLSGYFGQGYYGLSLSLEQDFTWTYFTGSSYSWSVILNRFVGLPFLVEDSYPYLVGQTTGWAQTKWHTVFAWLASDLTFSGTVLFCGFVGYIYGRLWTEIINAENPFSILVFCMLTVGAFYAPANNQLMHTPAGLSILVGSFAIYYRYRGSYNFHSLAEKAQAYPIKHTPTAAI